MKKIRKYTLSGISVFLLCCFSVTVLPLDAFHRHTASGESRNVCKDVKGQQCQHKMHLSTTNSFCWLCAVHFDKAFTFKPNFVLQETPVVRLKLYISHSFGVFQALIQQRTLRGPPLA
ncbi:MAG: hypothetical protein ACKOW2_08935 [Sphingobacteriaceae bacterium]